MPWSAEEYSAILKKTSIGTKQYEEHLLRIFPPLGALDDATTGAAPLKVVKDPAVFADSEDNLLAWSLPGILSGRLQVRNCTC